MMTEAHVYRMLEK